MAIFYGKTVDEAIANALSSLNLEKDQVEITVLEEAQKGFLGIGSHDAKVEVSKKVDDGERASDFLNGIFDILKIPATTNLTENGDKIVIDLITTNPTAVIGYRGEVLDALQTLAGAAANIGKDDYKKVVVDCENYREKREDTLKALAQRVADKAVKYGRKFSLEPMNPFERKVIHSALTEDTRVKTESEGVEPNRYIVVIPENYKEGTETEVFGKQKHSDKEKSNRSSSKRFDKRDKKEKSEVIKLEKKTIGYGTFLGNSLKED